MRFPRILIHPGILLLVVLAVVSHFQAQAQVLQPTDPATAANPIPNPLSDTSITPGKAFLYELEARFAQATREGGGPAFAKWFAEDAVILANGQAPVEGREALALHATWSPINYQLTWTPTAAVMSPMGEMGYTWGHYEGLSQDADGHQHLASGRYMTIWRKEPNGEWKVILDASNEEPAGAGDCCRLPKQ